MVYGLLKNYCFEAVDNDGKVLNLSLPRNTQLKAEHRDKLLDGVTVIRGQGLREGNKEIEVTAIPYYAWAHRGAGEMAVWLPESGQSENK